MSDANITMGQGDVASGQRQGRVAVQGNAAAASQGHAQPGQGNAVQQGNSRQSFTLSAAAGQGRQGNTQHSAQQNPGHTLKIMNDDFLKDDGIEFTLENGSVTQTLTKLVTSHLNINFPSNITFPSDVDNQSFLEKSAYICYAFYEIAMWKNQGLNNDNLPDVKDVGEAAVNRAIVVLTNNMKLIPEENKDKINEYITNIQGTVTPNVATVGGTVK